MSNYFSQIRSEKIKKIRLRVAVPNRNCQEYFVMSVGEQWIISQVASKALNIYIELFVRDNKVAKNLTVKAVRVAEFYVSKNEKVIDLLEDNDWITCEIIRVKGGYEYEHKYLQKILKEEIKKIKAKKSVRSQEKPFYENVNYNKQQDNDEQYEEKINIGNQNIESQINNSQNIQDFINEDLINKDIINNEPNQSIINQDQEINELSEHTKIKQLKKEKRINKKQKVKLKKKIKQIKKKKKQILTNSNNQQVIPSIEESHQKQYPKNKEDNLLALQKQSSYDNEGSQPTRKRSFDKRIDKNTIQTPTPEKLGLNPLSPKASSPKVIFHPQKIQSPNLTASKQPKHKQPDESFNLNPPSSKKHITFIITPTFIENKKDNFTVYKKKTPIIVEQDCSDNQKDKSPKITNDSNQSQKKNNNTKENKYQYIEQLLEKYRIEDSS